MDLTYIRKIEKLSSTKKNQKKIDEEKLDEIRSHGN